MSGQAPFLLNPGEETSPSKTVSPIDKGPSFPSQSLSLSELNSTRKANQEELPSINVIGTSEVALLPPHTLPLSERIEVISYPPPFPSSFNIFSRIPRRSTGSSSQPDSKGDSLANQVIPMGRILLSGKEEV